MNGDRSRKIAQNQEIGDRDLDKILRWFKRFHIWDFIYSNSVNGKANWKTQTKHSLDPLTLYRRWERSDQLIGVRFSTNRDGQTSYLMLDIDRGSLYHPYSNELKLRALLGSLESVGLCRFVPVRSSSSEGLHLYFPLPEPISCDKLSRVIRQTIENQGFLVKPGQLEIFPNCRTAPKTLFQAHRLPLQTGSYVLDKNWQPAHNSLLGLIELWEAIATYQDIELLKEACENYSSNRIYQSKSIEEWRNRLENRLREGFTDSGQTNSIIQDLCVYSRVFLGLDWDNVEYWVLEQIISLPGYKLYCGHQHEIQKRVRDWVRENTKSDRYYPLKARSKPSQEKKLTNQERAVDAERRIDEAIADLKQELGELPPQVGKREQLIRQKAKCGTKTLWKYCEKWHPNHINK